MRKNKKIFNKIFIGLVAALIFFGFTIVFSKFAYYFISDNISDNFFRLFEFNESAWKSGQTDTGSLFDAKAANQIETISVFSDSNLDSSLLNNGSAEAKFITMIAVGDIMLSREVQRKINTAKTPIYPFLDTAHITAAADITFGNLETTVFEGPPMKGNGMLFRSDPEVLRGLDFAGFDILSIANNHTYNYGEEGIIKTMQNISNADIEYCGAGLNYNEAHEPVIIRRDNVVFAFLCYNDTDIVPDYTFATDDKAGTALLYAEDITRDIENIKNDVDFVIVSMHSGSEYSSRANKRQKKYAHAAIDAGAHLVIGHHPHVLQPVEYYNDGIILYSLGNFIFDQVGVQQNRSAIARILFNSETKGISIDFIPIEIQNYSRPKLVEDETVKAQIFKRLVISAEGENI